MKATVPTIFDHFLADREHTCGPRSSGTYSPAIEIKKNDAEYRIVAWLPGVKREDLNITVEKGNLVLSGEFEKREIEGEELKSVYSELSGAKEFRRTLRIEEGNFDVEKVDAKLENGVLTITLPIAEQVKPRKIEIQSN